MTTHVLQFVELSDQDRKTAQPLDKLGKGDQVEVRVRRRSGKDQVVKATRAGRNPARICPRPSPSKGNGSLSSPRIRSSAQTMRPASWASPARSSSIGWISAIFRSGMSESIGGRS